LEPQEAVEKTVNRLLEVFQVSHVILVAYCKNSSCQDRYCFELVKCASREETSLEKPSSMLLDYPDQAQQWFQEHQVIAIEDREKELVSSSLYQAACDMNSQSLLATGIWFDNHLQGEICLYGEEVCHWQKLEKQLLIDVSHQFAIALQQMKLYQQLQTELNRRIELQQQLHYDAIHDKLTGLPNRYLLIDRLTHLIQSHPRKEEKTSSFFAIFFLDLNRFKAINDSFGHNCGDQLLMEVTQRLKTCLREEDTIARFGGDEFVILLEHLHQQVDAIEIVHRIHRTLSEPILLNHEVAVEVGTSIGIVFEEPKYTDSESMLRDADFAMYQAKQNQNYYVIFNDLPSISCWK